jgi:hypothetical protein
VLASNSTTWNAGPSAACTFSALGAVAGFIYSALATSSFMISVVPA